MDMVQPAFPGSSGTLANLAPSIVVSCFAIVILSIIGSLFKVRHLRSLRLHYTRVGESLGSLAHSYRFQYHIAYCMAFRVAGS